MEVRKLLYATDLRQPSFSEVEGLLSLLGLKEVIFLHTTKVEDWDGRFADYGLTLKTFMVAGHLVPAILNVARQGAVSLIAASLNSDKRRPLRGSPTTELLRASTLPVLILPEDAQASGSMEKDIFTHLIFATDWSPASEKALRYLLSLDLKTITKALEIVHVIDKKLSVKGMRDLKERLAQTRKILKEQGIDAESHVYAGKPIEEIMLAAKNYEATCIVMGTTGKSALKDLLSHRCSYGVAEASVVPTLVVP